MTGDYISTSIVVVRILVQNIPLLFEMRSTNVLVNLLWRCLIVRLSIMSTSDL
jgi:hypothetical protein